MSERADVVVIGGGVIGASCAYHLALAGARDLVLLEREKFLGTGATAKAAGGIRAQFSTEVNIRLSLASIAWFERMEDELDCDIEYHQYGYLFCLDSERDASAFRGNAELQNRLGVGVRLIEPAEVARRWPWIETSDLVLASYCPKDGHADTHGTTAGFERGARALGARVQTGRTVTGIRVRDGRVIGVDTDQGSISCDWVVDAAGPEADKIAAMAGLDIPVKPVRRHLFVTGVFPNLPEDMPLVVDFGSGFYARKETGTIMMGMANKDEPVVLNTAVDWDFVATIAEAGSRRIPVLEEASIFKGWAGCYDVTPDHHPVICETRQVKGLVLACGFSGHGFMHSPITGKLVAEIVTQGGPKSVDIGVLHLDRFARGELIHEKNVI